MNEVHEDIHDNLQIMFDKFDTFCKENGCFYDISCDESDRQGFILKDRALAPKMYEHMAPLAAEYDVYMDMNDKRKDGVLFLFTLQSVSEGFWKPLSKQRKRIEFSPFVHDNDAKRVRSGKVLPNMGKGKSDGILKPTFKESLDAIFEEEDHIPTVAIDLDGTLAQHYKNYDKNKIPPPRAGAKKAVDELKDLGVRIVINTVRGNEKLVKKWCQEHDIHFDYINENPDQPPGSSDKIIADVYIDDRAEDGSDKWSTIVKRVKDRLNEDQYKYPNRKHVRKQSMWRSSFGKTRSFGNVTEMVSSGGVGAVLGSSIPPFIEPSSNVGVTSAPRTRWNHEQPVKPYNKRKDLTDTPKTVDVKGTKLQPLVTPKDVGLENLEYRLEMLAERTVPTARVGRVGDPTKRSLVSRKAVPDERPRQGQEDRPEDFDLDDFTMDDVASQERRDPMAALGREVNLRPLGLFGPADQRQPAGGPVSNVRVQHPPDRSFDANSPKISVDKTMADNPTPVGEVPGADPLKMYGDDDSEDNALYKTLSRRFEEMVGESIVRPEDGYELVERLIDELGLATTARKIVTPCTVFVKACDGTVRLEMRHARDGFAGGPNQLSVYKNDRLLKEIAVDLEKNSVVSDLADQIRKLVG